MTELTDPTSSVTAFTSATDLESLPTTDTNCCSSVETGFSSSTIIDSASSAAASTLTSAPAFLSTTVTNCCSSVETGSVETSSLPTTDEVTRSFIIGCSNCERRKSMFLRVLLTSRALRIRLPTERISLLESFKSTISDKNKSSFSMMCDSLSFTAGG